MKHDSTKTAQQLLDGLINAPLSITKLKRNSAQWLLIYLFSGLVIFSLFSWFFINNQDAIKQNLLNYFFPQYWHNISEILTNFFFESQVKVVVANMILSGSLVVASIFLFPIKEKFSASFEKDSEFNNGKPHEFPLLYQAWEEIKLFIFYLAAQGVIFWIGYYPYQWASWLSIILSYLFLFFTFSLDFISPTLQRHRISYILILKVITTKPILALAFGLFFSLPAILLSQYLFTFESLSLIEISSILFIANIFLLTLAIPAGTQIASTLLHEAKQTKAPATKTKAIVYASILLTFVTSLLLHGKLLSSIHHKSQILKANYNVDWSSVEYALPSFSQLINGEALSNFSIIIEIHNPTDYDIIIEKSKFIVTQQEHKIAQLKLNGFQILAGKTKKIAVQLDSVSDLSKVTSFKDILEDWRVDMYIDLLPGIPFILNIAE